MRGFVLLLLGLASLPALAQTTVIPPDTQEIPLHRDAFEGLEFLREPGFDSIICPFRSRIDYQPGEIECGLIKVPENREVKDSRSIELHFVRLAARGEDHEGNPVEIRDDPVIYLTGGPGVKVEGYVSRLKDHRVLAKRDLYILEQRGIGYSGDFCPFFASRNRGEQIHDNFPDSQRAFFRQARRCIDNAREAGVDVRAYHTFENARDVKALRMALELEQWNVWGISYGSVLAQALIKVDEPGIRAAVIDAIVPLDLHQLMRISHWHQRNLDMLFEACEAQSGCNKAHADLSDRYRQAIARISEQPIALELEANERYPDGRVWMFQDLIVGLPFSLLYEQSTHAAIPAIIQGLTRAVEREDETLFRAIAVAETSGGFGSSPGMSTAVRCLDGYVDRMAEHAPGDFERYPLLAGAFGTLQTSLEAPQMCRDSGLEPRDPAQYTLVETELPILVANGRWDPITPTPLAEYIMSGLSNGRLVEFPHAGHGPTRSLACAGDFLNAYFDDPQAALDMSCVEDGEQAAEYIGRYFRTDAVPRAIVMQQERKSAFITHMSWGGVGFLLNLAGVILILGSGLVRVLNGSRLPAAGGTRFVVFLAAACAVTHVAGIAGAFYASAEITEALLLFGALPWAWWFAWLAPLGALFALFGLFLAWRERRKIPFANRLGLWLVALASISQFVFSTVWRLGPI